MKQKILDAINEFVSICYTMFKLSAGDFAKENFPKIVDNFWDETKSSEENVNAVKEMFETNRKLNEAIGNPAAAQVIAAFQKGWLNKI